VHGPGPARARGAGRCARPPFGTGTQQALLLGTCAPTEERCQASQPLPAAAGRAAGSRNSPHLPTRRRAGAQRRAGAVSCVRAPSQAGRGRRSSARPGKHAPPARGRGCPAVQGAECEEGRARAVSSLTMRSSSALKVSPPSEPACGTVATVLPSWPLLSYTMGAARDSVTPRSCRKPAGAETEVGPRRAEA